MNTGDVRYTKMQQPMTLVEITCKNDVPVSIVASYKGNYSDTIYFQIMSITAWEKLDKL